MDFKNASKSALIAGGLFGLMALNMLGPLFRYFNFFNLLWMISYAAVAVMLILGKRDMFSVAAFGAMAANSLLSVLRYFSLANLIGFLPNLTILLVVVVALTDLVPDQKANAAKLWFVPAALAVVSMMFSLLMGIINGYFPVTIWTLIRIAALLLSGLWAVAPNAGFQDAMNLVGMSASAGNGEASAYQASAPVYNADPAVQTYGDAYCSMAKHILLLLFTCGIWLYIWIYRITEYLNRVEGEPRRNPTNQLLLCLFVPFYYIYWIYQSAQRIDKLSISKGQSGDMATLCLIMALFVGILPPILMQDKINNLVKMDAVMTTAGQAHQEPQHPAPRQIPQETQRQEAQAPAAPKTAAAPNAAALAEELKIYKELVDAGILTAEEFEAKKRQLLNL
jgi:hypothetical protein